MMDVRDLPIWSDCPFRDKIPAHITIRRGYAHGIDSIFFDDIDTGRGASCHYSDFAENSIPHILNAIKPPEWHEEQMRQIKAKFQAMGA